MLWILLAVLLMIWASISRLKNRKLYALAKQSSSKSISLPIIGHAYKFLGTDEDRMVAFEELGKEAYGNEDGIICHWQGNLFYVLVADPVTADVLLKTCLEKVDLMRLFRVLLGNGSIFAPVSIWRPRRKILAPTFSQRNLNSFVQVFSLQSRVMADQVGNVAGKGAFSMWKYFTSYTMDSVFETTLGIKMNSQLEPERPFLGAFENCCQIDAKRICQPWFYNDTVNKIFNKKAFLSYAQSKELIWKFMNKIIEIKWEGLKKKKLAPESNQENKQSWKTFLELLIESPGGYGNVELREETLVIVLAGTDTSAVGAAFTTVMLAKYPDIQEKVYEELQDIFGNSDRPVSHEDLPRLKYLDAVIRETLRLYPPVPVITRKVENDVKLPSGMTLSDGCNVVINIWSIHRNPKYWGHDAELFRPERFIETPLTHPAAFMPFSYGPRSCLGYQYAMMSMKTVLATLLRRYRFISSEAKNGSVGAKNGSIGTKNEPVGAKNGSIGAKNGSVGAKNGSSKTNDDPNKPKLRVKFDIMLKHVNDFEIQLELRT